LKRFKKGVSQRDMQAAMLYKPFLYLQTMAVLQVQPKSKKAYACLIFWYINFKIKVAFKRKAVKYGLAGKILKKALQVTKMLSSKVNYVFLKAAKHIRYGSKMAKIAFTKPSANFPFDQWVFWPKQQQFRCFHY
jgi:hypothetical protein